jgi:hypothetical protein
MSSLCSRICHPNISSKIVLCPQHAEHRRVSHFECFALGHFCNFKETWPFFLVYCYILGSLGTAITFAWSILSRENLVLTPWEGKKLLNQFSKVMLMFSSITDLGKSVMISSTNSLSLI